MYYRKQAFVQEILAFYSQTAVLLSNQNYQLVDVGQ